MFEFLFENRDKEKAELISLFYNNFADAGETGEDSASEIINISLSAGGQEHENERGRAHQAGAAPESAL